jgi:hypothetical protein
MIRGGVVGALAAVAVLAVGGCSSSDAAPEADLCASADALQSSVAELRDVQVVENGTEALRQAFADVGDDVDRLADQARDEFSDQVSGVQSAAGDLGTAIDTLVNAPSAAALVDARSAVRTLVAETDALLGDVRSSC